MKPLFFIILCHSIIQCLVPLSRTLFLFVMNTVILILSIFAISFEVGTTCVLGLLR